MQDLYLMGIIEHGIYKDPMFQPGSEEPEGNTSQEDEQHSSFGTDEENDTMYDVDDTFLGISDGEAEEQPQNSTYASGSSLHQANDESEMSSSSSEENINPRVSHSGVSKSQFHSNSRTPCRHCKTINTCMKR